MASNTSLMLRRPRSGRLEARTMSMRPIPSHALSRGRQNRGHVRFGDPRQLLRAETGLAEPELLQALDSNGGRSTLTEPVGESQL
jgi:hypothetical protein